jgi:DNA-binding transcriptional LysR family regulator
MKISHFKALQSVATVGTFGGAALELGCTQSSVSYAIRELEHHVGCRLFTRSRSGCEPTSEGLEVIVRGARITEMFEELRNLRAKPSGIVRVSCLQSVGESLLSRLVEQCWSRYPDIRIDIFNDTESHDVVLRALRLNEADVAITYPLEDEQYLCHALPKDPYVLVLPPSRGARIEAFAELSQLRYLEHESACTSTALELLAAHGFARITSFRATSVQAILPLVRRGLGYSILPRLALPTATTELTVAALPLPEPVSRSLAVVARPYSLLSRPARAVIEILRSLDRAS